VSDEEFVTVLEKAINGDIQSIYVIINEYEGLIIKNCIVNDKFDEDCKSIIIENIIKNIKKFKNYK